MSATEKIVWPNDARCAVMLTFDFDAETNWISRDASNIRRPGTLSQGTYGAKVGVPKILEYLAAEGLPATFFVPGWVADNRTAVVEAIARAGHEIGHHGYLHKWIDPDDQAGELEELERGLESLKRVTGQSPLGYRAPSGETSQNLIRLLSDRGFLYDSSLLDDVNPYHHYIADTPSLVELPWHWSLDDAPFMLTSIKFHRPIFTNEHIAAIWRAEFEEIREWGGLFNLAMHPQAIGRPSRLRLLREFVGFLRDRGGVWFATGTEVARAWAAQHKPDPSAPRISPFLQPAAA